MAPLSPRLHQLLLGVWSPSLLVGQYAYFISQLAADLALCSGMEFAIDPCFGSWTDQFWFDADDVIERRALGTVLRWSPSPLAMIFLHGRIPVRLTEDEIDCLSSFEFYFAGP